MSKKNPNFVSPHTPNRTPGAAVKTPFSANFQIPQLLRVSVPPVVQSIGFVSPHNSETSPGGCGETQFDGGQGGTIAVVPALCQDFADDVAMDVGQAALGAVLLEGQALVVEADAGGGLSRRGRRPSRLFRPPCSRTRRSRRR